MIRRKRQPLFDKIKPHPPSGSRQPIPISPIPFPNFIAQKAAAFYLHPHACARARTLLFLFLRHKLQFATVAANSGGRRRMRSVRAVSLRICVFLVSAAASMAAVQQQPLDPGGDFGSTTVPAFSLPREDNRSACRLDLSDELFGGVGDACVRGGLDRSRCCPVLAAWLFAAHARSALELQPPPPPAAADDGLDGMDRPMMPDDNQKCVESLQSALERRDIRLPQPNATCDTVLCFCGIRLHQIGSLRCPAAFNISNATAAAGAITKNATPTAAVRQLERDCRNASYAGCTRCLHSLEKVKGHGVGGNGGGDRAAKMFARDCQLMGLTWLLARNKTAYIPTVSAVLRAVLYSSHPPHAGSGRCSPDQENMPLAVDSLQFQRFGDDSAGVSSSCPAASAGLLLLILIAAWVPFL